MSAGMMFLQILVGFALVALGSSDDKIQVAFGQFRQKRENKFVIETVSGGEFQEVKCRNSASKVASL